MRKKVQAEDELVQIIKKALNKWLTTKKSMQLRVINFGNGLQIANQAVNTSTPEGRHKYRTGLEVCYLQVYRNPSVKVVLARLEETKAEPIFSLGALENYRDLVEQHRPAIENLLR